MTVDDGYNHLREDPHHLCAHRRYRLTCQEYDDLLARQGGTCGVCNRAPRPATTLSVDHDHALGPWAVRGLVCHYCNTTAPRRFDAGQPLPSVAVGRYLEHAWHRTRSAA